MSDDSSKKIKEFKELEMAEIIGGPLAAVIDSQTKLASVSSEFIEHIGVGPFDKNEATAPKATPLSFDRNSASNNDELPSDKQNNSDGNDGV